MISTRCYVDTQSVGFSEILVLASHFALMDERLYMLGDDFRDGNRAAGEQSETKDRVRSLNSSKLLSSIHVLVPDGLPEECERLWGGEVVTK